MTATTEDILREIGLRLQRHRLQIYWTAAHVAAVAGQHQRPVRRAEAGDNPTLETRVRILWALVRLYAVDAFLAASLVSPIQLTTLAGHERQRAASEPNHILVHRIKEEGASRLRSLLERW